MLLSNFFEIDIHEIPTVSIQGDTTVCYNQTAVFTAGGAFSYEWENTISGNNFELVILSDTLLHVTGQTIFGCTDSAALSIHVLSLPDVEIIISGEDEICQGESINLQGSGANGFLWDNGAQTSVIIETPMGSTVYSVVGTDEYGCQNTDSISIAVWDVPSIIFTITQDTLCDLSESITLVAEPIGGLFSGNGVTSNVFNPGTNNWGINEIVYSYIDEHSCVVQETATVFVDDCSSVSEPFLSELNVYPNPFEGILSMQTNQTMVEWCVYDQAGRTVAKSNGFKSMTIQMDMSTLQSGAYQLVVCFADGSKQVKQLLKK